MNILNEYINTNLTGVQACVLSTLLVNEFDLKNNLRTGGYICGYRGSPLAGFDKFCLSINEKLKKNNIIFEKGLNEDLALTSVAGTQMISFFGALKKEINDGVVGYWYGKGPGLDRSLDVLHHYNFQGTSKNGGVILFCGDDLQCSSSTMPHHSVDVLKSFFVPVLYPSSVEEIFELTLKGVYLSRYSGLYVGLKIITDIADAYQTISSDIINKIKILKFQNERQNNIILNESGIIQEEKIFYEKINAAKDFISKNEINKFFYSEKNKNTGIVCSGKNFQKITEIFGYNFPCDVFFVRCSWPLPEEQILKFSENKKQLFFIEEKNPLIEQTFSEVLYKNKKILDLIGSEQLKRNSQISTKEIFDFLNSHLNLEKNIKIDSEKKINLTIDIKRKPYFCGGCPHNTGIKIPKNSKALLGIGCHYLARFSDPINFLTINPMGYEGGIWVSINKFLKNKNHIFVNLGDGTYFHSGILSIRFAVATKTPVTFKILFNNVVGMTGGQDIDGELTLEKLVQQLTAEGVKKIAIVSHYFNQKNWKWVKKYNNVECYKKDKIIDVQKEFENIKDVTVVIYDQMCATEKKRRIKRKILSEENERVYINSDICDACGDCQKKSLCLSVKEKNDEFYIKKREIDKENCANDLSCVQGYCPSFIVFDKNKKLQEEIDKKYNFLNFIEKYKNNLNIEQKITKEKKYKILIYGIGGNGTSTLTKILSDSSIESNYKKIYSLDQTGLSQRYGEVYGTITLFENNITEDDKFDVFDLAIFLDYRVFLSNINSLKSKKIIVNESIFNSVEKLKDSSSFQDFNLKKLKEIYKSNDKFIFYDFSKIMNMFDISEKNINLVITGFAYQLSLLPIELEALEKNIKNYFKNDFSLNCFIFGRILGYCFNNNIDILPKKEENIENKLENILKIADTKNYQIFLNLKEKIKKDNLDNNIREKLLIVLFDILYEKDEFEISRLWLKFIHENNIKKGKIFISPYFLRKYKKKIGVNVLILKFLFNIIYKFKFIKKFNIFTSLFKNNDKKYRKEVFQYLNSMISNKNYNYEKINLLYNLIQMIRGFGYIREEKILQNKYLLEKILDKKINF